MDNKFSIKIFAIFFIALLIFFIAINRIVYQDNEQQFFKTSVAQHQTAFNIIESSLLKILQNSNQQNDYFDKKTKNLVSFYLRDKLALLYSYLEITNHKLLNDALDTNNNNVKLQTIYQDEKTKENVDISIVTDNNPTLAKLDIIYAIAVNGQIITNENSEFILNFIDKDNKPASYVLIQTLKQAKEKFYTFNSGTETFYALISSDTEKSILVAVKSDKKLLNINLKNNNQRANLLDIANAQALALAKTYNIEFALYANSKQLYSNLDQNIIVNDKLLHRAFNQGSFEYIDNNPSGNFVISYNHIKELDICLIAASPISNLNNQYFATLKNIIFCFVLITIATAAVYAYFIYKYNKQRKETQDKLKEEFIKIKDLDLSDSENTEDFNQILKNIKTNKLSDIADEISDSLAQVSKKTIESFESICEKKTVASFKQGVYETAKQIQRDALPTEHTMPKSNNMEIATYLNPAFDVSGNFYDVLRLDKENIAFIIGEVNNYRNVDAAILIGHISLIVKDVIMQGLSPAKILNTLNAIIIERYQGKITLNLIIGIINEGTGNFIISNANMVHPILITKDGVSPLNNEPPQESIGKHPETEYSQYKGILVQSDALLVYSHGVLETKNEEAKCYDTETLVNTIKSVYNNAADQLLIDLYKDLAKFRGKCPNDADTTIICIKQKMLHF